jgi:phosphoglycolate phosphatase-like HAD superfamily hydrolase
MRPFVRDGKDYIVILNLILRQEPVSRQRDFDRRSQELLPDLCASMGVSNARALEEIFQDHRRTLRQRDEAAWMEMNPLYSGVEDGLRTCRGHFDRIYVTTSKPSDAAVKILHYYQIDLATENVYGYDRVRRARGKNGHLAHLHELTGAPYSRIHFVDDQVSHLQSAAELGVGCFHATWGYTTPEQVKDGISASVNPLREDSVAAWMRRVLA